MEVTFFKNQSYYPKVGLQGEEPNTYPTKNLECQPLALEITKPALLLHKPYQTKTITLKQSNLYLNQLKGQEVVTKPVVEIEQNVVKVSTTSQ